jgi:hypothetical protein
MNTTAKAANNGAKEITLPSGKVATIGEFKGKHVMQAQRIADGDQGKMLFAMIALVVTIDGKGIVMEEMEEMEGRDCLKLMAEFSTENF